MALFLFGLDKQNQISNVSVFDKVFETHYVSIFHEISTVLTSSAVAKTQWTHMICEREFLVVETTEFWKMEYKSKHELFVGLIWYKENWNQN